MLYVTSLQYHQNIFNALKIPYVPPIHPSFPSSKLLATTDLFTVFIVLPFSECRIVGIIQYVTFSDWIFHLGYSMSFHSMTVHFFLVLNNIPLSASTRLFIHSPIEGNLGYHQVLAIIKNSCYKHLCVGLCGQKFLTHLCKYQGV